MFVEHYFFIYLCIFVFYFWYFLAFFSIIKIGIQIHIQISKRRSCKHISKEPEISKEVNIYLNPSSLLDFNYSFLIIIKDLWNFIWDHLFINRIVFVSNVWKLIDYLKTFEQFQFQFQFQLLLLIKSNQINRLLFGSFIPNLIQLL